MKRCVILLFCVTSIVFFCSSDVLAAGQQNYVVGKLGVYSPESDDLEDWDNGFNGEIAFGHYFNQNMAVEVGVGYFESERSWWLDTEGDLTVVPVTVALKGIIPVDRLELYGLGGIGMYFVNVEWRDREDDDTVLGGFLGAGVNYNLTQQWFLGVEGKYLWAENDIAIDGWTFTGNIGFRF